eukprot:TRINITY_DN2038_c0_g1_i2.p2 TRINITY_DN2038_c0_g1~~TRINITY_DN2038_c0_g1_i2.p2  ORF type:complete len:183 (-),score=25.22 TRINITY_DN2038_c0_g1_i2:5-553(-)
MQASVAATTAPSPAFVSRALLVTAGSTRVARTLLRTPPRPAPRRARRTPPPATPTSPPLESGRVHLSPLGPTTAVQLLDPRAVAPSRGSAAAAGYDLSALEDGSVAGGGAGASRRRTAVGRVAFAVRRVVARGAVGRVAWRRRWTLARGQLTPTYGGGGASWRVTNRRRDEVNLVVKAGRRS